MIRELLYLTGPPGVGKSTLASWLTLGWDTSAVRDVRVPHALLVHPGTGECQGLELGVRRADFPGTDALSMSIGPAALEFVLEPWHPPFAFGEGARLATRPFLGGVVEAGVALTLVALRAAQPVLDARCAQRGSTQNTSWRRGAATRAERIAAWAGQQRGARVVHLDAAAEPLALRDAVREAFPAIDPRSHPCYP